MNILINKNITHHTILLGDIMLDHTIYGDIHKIANEAPLPVIDKTSETHILGGCGNVLMNILALGTSKAHIYSKIGNDDNGKRIIDLFPKDTVIHNCIISSSPTYKTTTKHRIYSSNKLIARYDDEIYEETTDTEEILIIQKITNTIEHNKSNNIMTSIIFSDYNKGFLTKSLCQSIIKIANQNGIITIVDPKNDYTKYMNCTIIKPNKSEVNKVFGINIDTFGLKESHIYINNLIHCNASIITLADEGITLYDNINQYRIKETKKEATDVTGAGDIVCSVLGVYYSIIEDKNILINIANHLATISINYIGSHVIGYDDIINTYLYINNIKNIEITYIKEYINILKTKKNKRIVFTNGCFDILHSAHVKLFKYCKSLGDIVIVGINSDNSIKRLKGSSRPINTLEDRITILNAIHYIDFIIPYEEDTPLELIKQIQPDYLVKGGDYTIESIIGREYAKQTSIFNYIDGKSTTNIIKQCKQP